MLGTISTKLDQVTENGIVVTVNDTQETWTGFDTIVTAVGSQSLNELEEKLKGIVKKVYVIGDAAKPRKCADAVLEGAETGSKI